MITENQLIYVALESVQGTEPATTPTTTDFLRVHNISVTPNVEYHSPAGRGVSLSPYPGVLGKKYMDISFQHELQVNNSSQTVPPCDALLQACGWDDKEELGASAVDGKYYPASERGLKCTKVPFDAGDGTVAVGDTVVGTDSGASGVCLAALVTSGAWENNAAGWLYLWPVLRTPGAADRTTGSGQSDLTMGGTYTGNSNTVFLIEITSAATPDVFKWNQDGGSYTENVEVTGNAQTLADGVTVTFGSTTGHTANNVWTITANDLYEDNELLTVSGTECTVNGTQITSAVTLWAYLEDTVYKINGAKGNVVWNLTAGGIAMLDFTLTGEYLKSEDTSFPTSVTDDGGSPLVALNQTFSWGTEAPCVDTMSFSLNNTVTVPSCLDATHGAGNATITGRAPEVSWNPTMKVAADEDVFTPYEAVTQTLISYTLSNATVDVDIYFPAVEIKNIQESDTDGILRWDLTGQPTRSTIGSGDDCVYVQFKAS